MDAWSDITQQITETINRPFESENIVSIGGGCINQTFCISGNGQRFFVKINHAEGLSMFDAEAKGLFEIGQTGCGTHSVLV